MQTPLLNPDEIRQRIWQELQRATQDRHSEWRTPVLATVSRQGAPDARTVVLRHADAKLSRLQIYTDSRSPKVAALADQPSAILVFWSKRLSWQLRVRVQMSVQIAGPQVEAVWDRVRQSAAAGDYLSAAAPGDVLPDEQADEQADQQALPEDPTRPHHLAILIAQVQEIDWLELARGGHRRALLGADTWAWRVP